MKQICSVVACILVASLSACDLDGKKNCDWVLEPEPDLIAKVQPGFVALCARNRKTMKQDCRLQALLSAAKSYQGKRFRYEDLKVTSNGIPRTIDSIKFCQ